MNSLTLISLASLLQIYGFLPPFQIFFLLFTNSSTVFKYSIRFDNTSPQSTKRKQTSAIPAGVLRCFVHSFGRFLIAKMIFSRFVHIFGLFLCASRWFSSAGQHFWAFFAGRQGIFPCSPAFSGLFCWRTPDFPLPVVIFGCFLLVDGAQRVQGELQGGVGDGAEGVYKAVAHEVVGVIGGDVGR